MVVLTIVTKTNGESFNFQEAIPKVDFMKVVSCSLYNSWHNLKKRGTVTVPHKDDEPNVTSFPPVHYTLEYLEKQMKRVFTSDNSNPFETEIYTSFCQLIIRNKLKRSAMFDDDLKALVGVDRVTAERTAKINLSPPTTYFIHCDLIDKQKNLFNGKMSDIAARFDIKGKPHEKVYYHTTAQQSHAGSCSTGEFVNGITISVKDSDGELFDFKGFPLEFELEFFF